MGVLLKEEELKELVSYKEALQTVRKIQVIPFKDFILARIVRHSSSDDEGADKIREHNNLEESSGGTVAATWCNEEQWERYSIKLVKALIEYLKFMGVSYPRPSSSISKYLKG